MREIASCNFRQSLFTFHYSLFTADLSAYNVSRDTRPRLAASSFRANVYVQSIKPSPMIRGKGDRLRWKRVDTTYLLKKWSIY